MSNSDEIEGKIVLIEDGSLNGDSCSYFKKVSEGQNAGAIAVVVYNKDNGAADWTDDLKTMGIVNGDPNAIKISSIFIRAEDGNNIRNYINEEKTIIKSENKQITFYRSNNCTCMFFINDVVVRNNNGNFEVYVAAGSRLWNRVLGAGKDTNTVYGSGHDAIYKSIDGGIIGQKLNSCSC